MPHKEKGRKVDYYECRKCGYRIPEIQFQMAKFDYECPRCRDELRKNGMGCFTSINTLSTFKTVYTRGKLNG